MTNNCLLCEVKGENVVVSHPKYRIIRVADVQFPGYFRVIWNEHVKEMSDLCETDRHLLWDVLNKVEKALIETMNPKKINLAEFGTMVPHLHWHLIPRYEDDACYPDSIWSNKHRSCSDEVLREREKLADDAEERIKAIFA